MDKYIIVSLQFEGIHCWPNCDIKEVEFLKNPHRHIFHVKAFKRVSHNDRDIEIIALKREMSNWVSLWDGDFGNMSCEDIAERLINQFSLHACQVLEDNENGALLQV